MQRDNGKVIVDEPGEIDDVRLRRDDFLPVLAGGMVEIDGDDASVRGMQVGQKVKDLAAHCPKTRNSASASSKSGMNVPSLSTAR